MSETKRIEFIDLAKGICILLVISMHIAPEIGGGFSFLTCLRMPLYYCLSGLFFKRYGGFKQFSIKKIDKLLIPFIGWYLLSYGIYYIRVLTIGHAEQMFKITDLFLEPSFYNGSLWFLLSLFWCNIIYFFIDSLSSKISIQALLVFSFASIGWFMGYNDWGNFLYIGSSFISLPFFFFGRQLQTTNILKDENGLKNDLILFSVCLASFILLMTIPKEEVFMTFYLNYIKSGNPITMYLISASLVLITLLLCKYVKRLPYISYLGRFSIIVLVTHQLFSHVLNRSIAHLFGISLEDSASHFILLVITILLMFLIIPLCRKYLPYICAQKNLLEKLRLKTKNGLSATNT